MIKVDKNTEIPSVSSTLGILQRHNSLMPQYFDYDKLNTYLAHCTLRATRILPELREALEMSSSDMMAISSVLKLWVARQGISELFNQTKTGISMDEDSITSAIATGRLTDYQLNTIKMYQEYDKMTRYKRTCLSYLQCPIMNVPSFDGHRMIAVRPEWHPQNTGRVAMREPAVQNLPREFHDLQTVPKGWVLIHTDSGQIEPRVIYSAFLQDKQIQALINLYDDAYYGVLHYVTMDRGLIDSGITQFEKMNRPEAELKEMRKEIKTYQNAVMYGSTSNPSGSPIKQALIDRIGQHPLRLAWLKRNEQLINQGETVFRTYFGTPIDISKSTKLEGKDGDERQYELMKLAINNPMQGTAADLMRLSVSEANKILSRETKYSYIISYIHDAGLFAVHESEYDRVADRLKDIVSYDVEGWLPIKADPIVGRDPGWFEDYF